jgi:hypothetical protein
MKEKVQSMLNELASLARNTIAARKVQKKALAAHCNVTVNTLTNFLTGSNVNVTTLLAVFNGLGMNIIDIARELETLGNFPEADSPVEGVGNSLNKAKLKEEADRTSTEQAAWRAGEKPQVISEVVS